MVRAYIAELIGTFGLVFCGTGAVVVDEVSGGAVSHLGIVITFGLIVLAMIYALGDISGAHLNPAVTAGFALGGVFPKSQVGPYIIAQTAGAILASAALHLFFPQSRGLGETLPTIAPVSAFLFEAILTFILMLVIISVATGGKEKGIMAGIAVGAVVALEAAFAGPVTGASMNPARSLAPALFTGHFSTLWVYLTAPFLGAALAVLTYRYLKPALPLT